MNLQNPKSKKFVSIFIGLALLAACAFALSQYQKRQELRQRIRDIHTMALEVFVPMLKIYKAYDENGPIELIRVGRPNDGGYSVAKKALDAADALLGYGVFNDISFEEQFSDRYNRPSFGFDCTVKGIEIKNKLCTFIPQCIASDTYIHVATIAENMPKHFKTSYFSPKQLSTFSQHLDTLKLKGKKIFLKMDIEGAEYDAFEDIYKHTDSITGIALEIHFVSLENTLKAIRLLTELQKDFVLINVHGNNWASEFFTTNVAKGEIPKVLELSFIHKKLVTKYHIAEKQIFPSPMDMPCNPKQPDAQFEIY